MNLKHMKVSISITLMLTSFLTKAHGGISALDGLLELMIMLAILAAIAFTWIVFILILIFAKEISLQTFSRFRKITYPLLALLALLLLYVFVNESADVGTIIIATLIFISIGSITEIIIFIAKKARQINS